MCFFLYVNLADTIRAVKGEEYEESYSTDAIGFQFDVEDEPEYEPEEVKHKE